MSSKLHFQQRIHCKFFCKAPLSVTGAWWRKLTLRILTIIGSEREKKTRARKGEDVALRPWQWLWWGWLDSVMVVLSSNLHDSTALISVWRQGLLPVISFVFLMSSAFEQIKWKHDKKKRSRYKDAFNTWKTSFGWNSLPSLCSSLQQNGKSPLRTAQAPRIFWRKTFKTCLQPQSTAAAAARSLSNQLTFSFCTPVHYTVPILWNSKINHC